MRIFTAQIRNDIALRNRVLCYALMFLQSMYLGVAVINSFYGEHGLDELLVLNIPAAMSAMGAIVELPCGSFADRIGNRRAMIVAITLQAVQAALLAFWTETMLEFLVVAALNAISWGIINGTMSSVVSATSTADESDTYEFISQCWSLFGQAIATLIGMALALTINIQSPFQWQPLPFLLALPLAFLVRDSAIQQNSPTPSANTQSQKPIRTVLRALFVTRRDVGWMMCMNASLYASTLAAMWLVQPDMLAAVSSMALLLWAYVPRSIFSFLIVWKLRARLVALGLKRLQTILVAVISACVLFASIPGTGMFGGIVMLMAVALENSFTKPLSKNAIKTVKETKSCRTTAQSANDALRALAATSLPLFGWLAEDSSDLALFCLGWFCLALSGFFLYMFRKSHVTPATTVVKSTTTKSAESVE